MELINVLSDTERSFSGVPATTCRYGGAIKMLLELTYGIVKFQSH